jgi:hypothetical protein
LLAIARERPHLLFHMKRIGRSCEGL